MKKNVEVMVKDMKLRDCLKNLGKDEFDSLYEEYRMNNKKRISVEEKEEVIIESIISSFMVLSVFLKDEEIKELGELVEGKLLNKVSDKLLESHLVFEIDGCYVLPLELKEMYDKLLEDEFIKSRKLMLISVYILINGAIEIDKIIELAKLSGVKILKKDIKEVVKENKFIIKDNVVYANDMAVMIDERIDLINFKKDNEYRVVELEEIMLISIMMSKENGVEKLKKALGKTVEKDKLDALVASIYNIIVIGGDYLDNLVVFFKENGIKLSDEEEDKIFEIVHSIYRVTPSWELNGFAPNDVDFLGDEEGCSCGECCCDECDDECSCHDNFDDLCDNEKLEIYINYYMLINGIIPTSKLLDILRDEHKFDVTKNDLISLVSCNDELVIEGEYVCLDAVKEEKDMILMLKNGRDDYKIIGDVDSFLEEYDDNMYSIEEVCLKHDVGVVSGELQSIMSVGFLDEELLETVLDDYDIELSSKKLKNLNKELNVVLKNMRVWSLNGYKRSEISISSEKIGRNDPCTCGSGKKYKKCCGK